MILPTAFAERLKSKIGQEGFEAYTSSFKDKPLVSVRINPHKSQLPIDKSGVPWCNLGYYLEERPVFTLDPDFHSGSYYVQEASSMFLWHILESISPDNKSLKILDLSAAPGGKSTLIANWLDNNGLLCANDPIKNRAYTLKYNILKEGYHNVIVTNNDPKDFGRMQNMFDIILIDAPCSGEGMFRKDPATIQEWSEDNVQLCSARQKRIIADVLPALKEGGHLIYSTCTFNESENIDNVLWMQQEFGLKSRPIDLNPALNIAIESKEQAIGYQFYPHIVQGEGFFISVLQKQSPENHIGKLKENRQSLAVTNKKQEPLLTPWVNTSNPTLLTYNDHEIHLIPEHSEPFIFTCNHYLKIIYFGTILGNLNKNVLIPDHSLALSLAVNPDINKIELSKKSAQLYLKKELASIDNDISGWMLATYNGNGLGWLKNLQHRINNYLPVEYRILMDLH